MYDYIERGKGVVLIGSHHGSFEILRILGTYFRKLPVNILMYKNEGQNILKILGSISPDYDVRFLEIGNPGDIIKARERLERGELLGILGDRILKDGKGIECDFLGGKVMMPDGPFRLAELMRAPTFFFSGVYLGKNRYHISIEMISDAVSAEERRRHDRQMRIEGNVKKMAKLLEDKCLKYPDNWFNFYSYWKK
jgi:predicted LPLAT superfamily acyltransferase